MANTTIPVLLTDGSLDTKTPADVLGDVVTHFTAPHQQYVLLPNVTHVVYNNSPATASTMGIPCGTQIIGAFLVQPTGDLNTRCAMEIPPLDFRGTTDLAKGLFGTSALYEDAAPSISSGGIVNAASSQRTFAPGMIMSIFGTNLSRGLSGASKLPLPASMGETSVTVNGVLAPLYYASTAQIGAQIPVVAQAGPATVALTVNGQTSTQTITLTTAAPGIFTNGGALPGRPAKPGDEVAIYITGQGPLSPALPTGSAPAAATPVDQLPQPSLSTEITVGGVTPTLCLSAFPFGQLE